MISWEEAGHRLAKAQAARRWFVRVDRRSLDPEFVDRQPIVFKRGRDGEEQRADEVTFTGRGRLRYVKDRADGPFGRHVRCWLEIEGEVHAERNDAGHV